jgi:hypothetical protein
MNVLNTHRTYYNQLHQHYLNALKVIDENTDKKITAENDLTARQTIKDKAEDAKRSLEENFNETTNVICKVYDKYLTDNLPKPSVIQAKLKVRVLKKNLKFDGLVLKPVDE